MSAIPIEQWRPIPGYEDRYDISDQGRVYSRPRKYASGGYLTPTPDGKGYFRVSLSRDGSRTMVRLSVLVADAFHGPRPLGQYVRHLDGNRLNNSANNLAYGTPSENTWDAVRHGTHAEARKTHCPQGHPYDESNTYVWRGQRNCRTCNRQVQAARVKRRRAAALRVSDDGRDVTQDAP